MSSAVSRSLGKVFYRLRLMVNGLSAKSDPMSPLLEDDRYRTRLALYQRLAPLLTGRWVFEIGSGTGFQAPVLAGAGVTSYRGVEQDPRLQKFASKRYARSSSKGEASFELAPNLRPEAAAAALDKHAGCDAVLALDWLPQCASPEDALATLARSLESGRAAFSMPAVAFPAELAEARRVAPELRHPYVWYWRAMVEAAFDQVRLFRFRPPDGVWPHAGIRRPSVLCPEALALGETSALSFRDRQPALAAVMVADKA